MDRAINGMGYAAEANVVLQGVDAVKPNNRDSTSEI